MSFAAQEQAMFDLLFNAPLRMQFAQHRATALQPYALTADELQDFHAIRLDALEFDANLRSAILLAAIAKTLPLTFCGLSSFEGGVDRLRAVLDAALVRAAPATRPVHFAERLRAHWSAWPFINARESALMQAILDAEWGMASTLAARRDSALADLPEEPAVETVPDDWLLQPVSLAPFVSAGVLPQSHAVLKTAWCPEGESALWRALQKQPLPMEQRQAQFAAPQPRLLLARAVVAVPSACDPVIEHHITELPEGFASLFQYVNGENSVSTMLMGLQQAGAPKEMLASVQAGFRQLLASGMLVASWDGED